MEDYLHEHFLRLLVFFLVFFLSLYAFPPQGALGYEAEEATGLLQRERSSMYTCKYYNMIY